MKRTNLLFLLLILTPAFAVQAHFGKSHDRNGGHYDEVGRYHCHLNNCELTESRWEFRRRTQRAARDSEKFFNEDDWPYWEIMSTGCQNMRTEVLVITSKTPVTFSNPRNCQVRTGLWFDEYTGEEFTRAAQMAIDHIIPPTYADSSNGYQWDDQTRRYFANDPANLMPVSKDVYSKKRQRGIGGWQPREEFLCDYALAWRDIAAKYDLTLFARERRKISETLEECGIFESEEDEDNKPVFSIEL
jgi:hypothetical protein